MSSHHFVREGQEPALLVIGDTGYSSIEGLLEWAPTILINSAMVEKALSWGIRIDAVFAAGDEYETMRHRFAGEQIVDFIKISDEPNVIKAATDYLLKRQQTEVALATQSFSGIRSVVESQLGKIAITVLDNEFRWIPTRKEFRKWTRSAGAYRIIPSEGSSFDTIGLRHIAGEFVAESEGMVTISAHGLIWVGESYKN